MTTAVVATYKEAGTIWNVKDDLISTGIPSDSIKIDKEYIKVRVMVPDQTNWPCSGLMSSRKPSSISSLVVHSARTLV